MLTTLPDAIGALRELRHLDLRGNPLTHIPASLLMLPRLEKLDLRWVACESFRDVIAQVEVRGCVVYF
jgi:hypothetical protein